MNATHGLPRRPGESPPNLPAAERAAAYFGGRLSLEDLETLQDDLAHDPILAETLLDWQCFAPPSVDYLPTATLTLWQNEDKARLDVAIEEEREAREEAARLIGIPVEDLGRVPPPPAPTFSAEEQERARRAIERLKPLSAAERLEFVKREPEAFAGEAVASECLVEARAALPASPEDSTSWADASLSCLHASAKGDRETGAWTTLLIRARFLKANCHRCNKDARRAEALLEAAFRDAKRAHLLDPLLWAEGTGFLASIKNFKRDIPGNIRAASVSLALWEHIGLPEGIATSLWKLGASRLMAGDEKGSLWPIEEAIDTIQRAEHPALFSYLMHAKFICLERLGRLAEARRLLDQIRDDYDSLPRWRGIRWVSEGLISSQLGDPIGASENLRRAQSEFLAEGEPYLAALATLDLSLLLLSQNRVEEVVPLAISMGKTFEALGIARETLASWAILREAAERRELTQAIVRQVQEEISRPGAFRRVGEGGAGGGPLAKAEKLDHDLKGASAGPRTMDNVNRFPTPPGKTADSTDERSASYFAGALSEAETEKYQDQLANDPELAESLLDWQAFSGPTAEVVSPEELASWQAADRVRLQAAIEAEGKDAEVTPVSPVLQFPTATTAPAPKRHAWKWLAASAGLAAGLGGVMFATAPVPETYIVPVSTLRGDDDVTTLELGRWPHKALFRIDARTLGEIAEPQAALLDSMTDAVVATTTAKPCGEALCAQFWGLSPGNYRLELNDLATGQPRLVAYHPVELLATDRAP